MKLFELIMKACTHRLRVHEMKIRLVHVEICPFVLLVGGGGGGGGGTNQVRKGIQNETDVSSNEMKDQVPLLTQSRRMFSGVAVVSTR